MLQDRERALLRAQAAMRRWLRLDVRRWTPAGVAAARRLQILRDADVSTVLDVGANRGQFTKELRAGGYAGRIVSFEPLEAAYAALEEAATEDPLWTCHRLALSDAEGEAELHVAGNAVSSSLLDMESRHLEAAPESRYVGVERVRQACLDALVVELGLPADGVYLKVDVQGLESGSSRGLAPRCRGSSRSRVSCRWSRSTATSGSSGRCSTCSTTPAITRCRSSPRTPTLATDTYSRSTASS